MLFSLQLIVALFSFLQISCSAWPYHRIDTTPPPWTSNEVPPKDDGDEKVTSLGFDLSASYGAVAIAFANGTKIPIVRIDGDFEYTSLMKEMSEASNQRFPWTGSPWEFRIFVDMLDQLRNEAEAFLGYKIKAALVATPNLNGERSNALNRAIESLGLENLDVSVPDKEDVFRQTPAAFAASGFGLCKDYRNRTACDIENDKMSGMSILSILFTSNSLCVETSWGRSAMGYSPTGTVPTSMDFHLGYSLHDFNPDDRYYWTAVTERIMRGILYTNWIPAIRMPQKAFLFGDEDAVTDPRTKRAIDEAMTRLAGHTIPVYDNDPVFAVAKGTAELARRGQWPYASSDWQEQEQKLSLQAQ